MKIRKVRSRFFNFPAQAMARFSSTRRVTLRKSGEIGRGRQVGDD